jgi:hypothetical protein
LNRSLLLITLMLTQLLALVAETGEQPSSEKPAAARALLFKISASKEMYVLYEPAVVTYSVQNITDYAIKASIVMLPTAHDVEFKIEGPGGSTKVFSSGGIADVAPGIDDEILPREAKISEAEMYWNSLTGSLAFPEPGMYAIHARILVRGPGPVIYLESSPARFKVEAPSGLDAEAIAFFRSREDFLHLMKKGAASYCLGRPVRSCFEELNTFLKQHSGSAYAPWIMWDLGSRLAADMLDVSDRGDLAIDLHKRFLEKYPEHAEAANVMYSLVGILNKAGRKREEEELIQRFEKAYPERRDLLDQMREQMIR